MALYAIQQSTTVWKLYFPLILSSDHISPATGKSPTVVISKNGGAFGAPAGAVSELANGWYQVAGNATDTATLGPLILHATEASSDPTDVVYEVVAYNPQDGVRLGLTGLANAVPGAAGGLFIAGANAATSITTALTSNIIGNVTGNLSGSVGSVTGAVGSVTGAVGSVTGNVGGNVTGSVGSVVGAVGSVTAAVSILSGIKKNASLVDFEFLMTDSTNHNPVTGKVVTVTRSIDDGAFAAGTLSAVTEIAFGIYAVDFGAGDLNGRVITLRATAAGCDDTFVTIVPDP